MRTVTKQYQALKKMSADDKQRRRMVEIGLGVATIAWFVLWSQLL